MQLVFGNIIHQSLKCGKSVGEAKGHEKELKMPMVRSKCRFLYIWHYTNLVIPESQVYLREKFGSMQFIQELINNLNWEFIFDCELVQGPIVHTHPPRPILFLNQDHQ